MKGVSVLFLVGLCMGWAEAVFLNNRPFPTYSLENMPDTGFSCREKILGGYYADFETQCQMFHICVKVSGVGVQDFRFLCPNGTAFDQDHQICAEWEDVDCDATTLYYSSDNFDLYRIGSGFESKAVKYGEDEETFSLQRAETGDARINREHQTQRINQQKEQQNRKNRPQNNHNNDKEIFKGSSSSNFFNNRNGGKENDEDYDDNVNTNQDNDRFQKRKLIRKQHRPAQNENNNQQQNRRPVQNENNNQQQNRRPVQNENNNQQQNRRPVQNENNNQQQHRRPTHNENNQQNQNRRPIHNRQPQQQQQQTPEAQSTTRPQRPTGFVNNFAGSSFVPTTSRPLTTTQRQYNNAENFRENTPPSYTISTPAPFKPNNNPPPRPYNPTSQPPQKQTENYPTNFQKVKPNETPVQTQKNYQTNQQYDIPKVKTTENYPQTQAPVVNNRNNQHTPQYDVQKVKSTNNENYQTTPFRNTENYSTQFNKKITTPVKQTDNYPTTFAPKFNKSPNSGNNNNNYPSTFAPRTNSAYTQISQQTTQYKSQQNNYKQPNSTPRTTPFTQYTPTVPKITSTAPSVARSNRYDETQYDDGSYNSNYDRRDDEFLKTAHSQNIASSRNEYAKTIKNTPPPTQKPHYESPRPFSVSPNTPKATDLPKSTPKSIETNNYKAVVEKKLKDTSYDYAYYDTNVGSEPEYEIDTEIKKSSVKN